MKYLLDDSNFGGIAIDELEGDVRIAFDADHGEDVGEQLANVLLRLVEC